MDEMDRDERELRMPFSSDERQLLRQAYSIGPRMIAHLESIGIVTLADLAKREAAQLAAEINLHLGAPRMNAMGVRALQNAIDLARRAAGPQR